MSQPLYDPSSKWMIEEEGGSILYLAGARNVLSCKARKAEVVQPRKLPDGLLEVRFADRAKPALVLVEVATYPEKRVVKQIQGDIRLVREARGVLPEALILCLCPRGAYRVPQQVQERSPLGWTGERLEWKVIELWTLSAEDLLAAPNVGVVPWSTLAHFEGPPEVLLQRCRDRIDREGGAQRANLLAVTQVYAKLHFDKPEWLEILGGRKAMMQSPLIQEIVSESERTGQVKAILHLLQKKFGPAGPSISAGLAQVKEEEKLLGLLVHATNCASLQDFDKRLREELSAAAPISTRGKRRPRKHSE
jgi:predicted transposase YdaD